jgi:hypothetical protein
MKRRAAYLLVSVLVGLPLVSGIVHAIISDQPEPPAQKTVQIAQTKADDNPLAGVRQWYAYLDGNKIACYVDQHGNHRWFIVLPTPAQRADGEVMVTNDNPSDDAWNSYCSKEPVTAHW